jgi:hypothetical protein
MTMWAWYSMLAEVATSQEPSQIGGARRIHVPCQVVVATATASMASSFRSHTETMARKMLRWAGR